ncbi:MAG: hypothetical protein BAJATHORv1_30394 [Candidatus Thorarchaeota archaeon]|nr:MAG: hypothetical protein BAJATHORv1_30394 [Candidatus Thorarchaeota archaeon]
MTRIRTIQLTLVLFILVILFFIPVLTDSTIRFSMTSQNHTSADAWSIRPFSDASPFNIPIPDNAEIEPNSEEIVNNLLDSMSEGELFVGVDKWSVPVFFANSSTPQQDIDITDEWAIWDTMKDVPIPENALPDPEDDGHLCIIDNGTRIEYDFWQAEKTPSGWTASWGNKISLDSDGIYRDSWGARGSGFALAAGLIFPHEIDRGLIEHALVYSTDWFYVKSGGAVRPATTSDGISNDPLAIPEGARLQLNPSIDVDDLEMEEAGKVIARAMQNYGMFLCDNGGGHQVYAYNPINSGYSWEGILDTDDDGISWIFNSSISITDFRVLKLGPQIPDPGERTTLPDYIIYTSNTGTQSEFLPVLISLVLSHPMAILGIVLVIGVIVYLIRKRKS